MLKRGLYNELVITPNQKLLHSGHKKGFLIYGIFAIKFLTGANISEKLHMKLKERLNIKHVKNSKNIIERKHQPFLHHFLKPRMTYMLLFHQLIFYKNYPTQIS